ncbi:unnamed protein product [Closterium sp. NIES-64]|nr:unnamed protein product [Closterium sp. NIES-64]
MNMHVNPTQPPSLPPFRSHILYPLLPFPLLPSPFPLHPPPSPSLPPASPLPCPFLSPAFPLPPSCLPLGPSLSVSPFPTPSSTPSTRPPPSPLPRPLPHVPLAAGSKWFFTSMALSSLPNDTQQHGNGSYVMQFVTDVGLTKLRQKPHSAVSCPRWLKQLLPIPPLASCSLSPSLAHSHLLSPSLALSRPLSPSLALSHPLSSSVSHLHDPILQGDFKQQPFRRYPLVHLRAPQPDSSVCAPLAILPPHPPCVSPSLYTSPSSDSSLYLPSSMCAFFLLSLKWDLSKNKFSEDFPTVLTQMTQVEHMRLSIETSPITSSPPLSHPHHPSSQEAEQK